MDDITIRRAEPSDIAAVRKLVDDSWRATYGAAIPADRMDEILKRRHAHDLFAQQSSDDGSLFLVAERDGEIIGHAFASWNPDNLYLDRLHVRPGLKGGGVGTKLMQAVIDVAGSKPVTLELLTGNTSARGFYEHMGFDVVGDTPCCGGELGIAALVMERAPG